MREAYNFLTAKQLRRAGKSADRARESQSPVVEDLASSMYALTTDIEPGMAHDVMQGLGSMLSHVPFAVVGPAALVYYGRQRNIARVSIVCPAPCVRAVFSWAATKGMRRFQDHWRDSIAYRTSDGFLCRVRVRPLEEAAFSAIRVSETSGPGGQAKVMVLPSVVNDYARLYARSSHRWSHENRHVVADDILWMLRRIVASIKPGRGRNELEFTPSEVTWILSQDFWYRFADEFPEAVDLFSGAGVFRCLNRRAGLEVAGYPDKTRPTPALSEALFDADLHARVHDWMAEIERFGEQEEIEAKEATGPAPTPVLAGSRTVKWSEPLVSAVNDQKPSFRRPANVSYVSCLRSAVD